MGMVQYQGHDYLKTAGSPDQKALARGESHTVTGEHNTLGS